MGEVVLLDNGITDKADEDRWYDEEFFDLVLDRHIKHVFHRECREHVNFCVEKYGQVQCMI